MVRSKRVPPNHRHRHHHRLGEEEDDDIEKSSLSKMASSTTFSKRSRRKVFADASKEKALEREALIARAPKGTMKSAHALLANTVIDGEELTIAYDAREHG